MEDYFKKLNPEIKEYWHILSADFPEFLYDYINTPALLRLDGLSNSCGTDYTKMIGTEYWYSALSHSIGVALIIWHFTKDKVQTLAGLFHDIATPTFKHCIDFMYGDAEKQEITENETQKIIKNSQEIMALLKRDKIKLQDVIDYKIYPVADNEMPKLSADRIEYTFSSGLVSLRIWTLDEIRECYDNLELLEFAGNREIGFKDLIIAEKYIKKIPKLWYKWISDKDRIAMQFIADITKSMLVKNYLSIEDLYVLSEKEIIKKIEECPDEYLKASFKKFHDTTKVFVSSEKVQDKYKISVKSKKRYLNPLVRVNGKVARLNEVSEIAKEEIKDFLDYKFPKYVYFDFNFVPYE